MTARLFCRHCETHHEVELDDIKQSQTKDPKVFTFARNTYYYNNDRCFITLPQKLKEKSRGKGDAA